MPIEVLKEIAEIEDAVIDAKVYPDGFILLEIHRGDTTHFIRISPTGHKCEVTNSIRRK